MYIRLIDQEPTRYSPNQLRRDYPHVSFPAEISEETLAEYDVFPLAGAQAPEAAPESRVEESVAALIDGVWTQTWVQVLLTPDELTEQAEQASEQRKNERQQQSLAALEVVAVIVLKPLLDDMAEDDVERVASLFPDWHAGEAVAVGDIRAFDGVLWRVIQAHTTQADWTPPQVPALWGRVKSPDSTEWVAGISVTVGEQYTYQGVTYRVVQSHTTQAGWEPPSVPALWSVV
jgi:hypothetical protein